MKFLQSLFRKLLYPLVGAVLVVVSMLLAPRVLSQESMTPALPAGEYVVPDAIEQGYEQQPDYGYSPYAGGRAFPQQVYWGDTHLHTYYSFDAGAGGTRLTPADAYRLARGEEITTNTGQQVRLSRPYDFLVVTDHSDSLGAIVKFIEGTPEILANPQTKAWHEAINQGGEAAAVAMNEIVSAFAQGLDPEIARISIPTEAEYQTFWETEIEAAERFNTPGFFTALIGYEWTSLVTGDNLHRNVIYRDNGDQARQLLPKTAETEQDPQTLWQWMQNYEDQTGGQVLAIPHNGNLSNGLMFAETNIDGTPLTADYTERRQRWEPVYEVTQMKGDGETHPFLSPTDEFADFETWDKGNLDLTEAKEEEMLEHEYARSALRLGLGLEQSLGTNPFKFGMVGSTDSHTGMSAMEENNFFGKFSNEEPRPQRYGEVVLASPDRESRVIQGWELQAAGIAGVWARENTREALFDAFKRKEVYASTGPRMTVRLFGGWDFTESDALSRSLADVGYARGVPMGGDLATAPQGASPTFIVAALKDPIGANLDRIQIVKGWLDDNGETQEQVYDVVWSGDRELGPDGKLPPVGNTVDVEQAEWSNTIGAVELTTTWADPDFDPTQKAFYYARVLEIPTPRWTDYDHVRFGVDMPEAVPMTLQERCYTSPIWYSPA